MSRKPARRGRGRGKRPPPKLPPEDVLIERIAQQGDGEGRLADGTRVFAPLTLPGERVRLQPKGKRGDGLAAEVLEVLEGKPRQEPICPVFGTCGGCQLQHLPDADYVAWKSAAVATALSRHGIDVVPQPLLRAPVRSRRRATLSCVATKDGVVLGFNQAQSDRVVGIGGCPLLVPALERLIEPLRTLLGRVLTPPARADVALTAADAGALEMVVAADVEPDLAAREILAAFAQEHDLARLAWRTPGMPAEPVAARRDLTLSLGGVEVALPIGSFLQPSAEGEAILRQRVEGACAGSGRVADLYCGIGTFTLPLAARGAHVLAVDGDAGQAGALELAAGRAGLGGRVTALARDLQADPLSADELSSFDAVVFDPPRAGARAQAACLAESAVPLVVAVSCNPATMGRDLRLLLDGGYAIETLTPVDQFPMSYHVEAVAVLRRFA